MSQFNDVKEAELKVQRMNIKKKEVIVTAFEESPIWKYFNKSSSTSIAVSWLKQWASSDADGC